MWATSSLKAIASTHRPSQCQKLIWNCLERKTFSTQDSYLQQSLQQNIALVTACIFRNPRCLPEFCCASDDMSKTSRTCRAITGPSFWAAESLLFKHTGTGQKTDNSNSTKLLSQKKKRIASKYCLGGSDVLKQKGGKLVIYLDWLLLQEKK